MSHVLPPLPYGLEALAPHITQRTLEIHHGKHHNAYVTNLNKLVAGTPLENSSRSTRKSMRCRLSMAPSRR